MPNNDPMYDVLIAGGGPPGLALAAILSAAGLRAAVIDPGPRPQAPTAADARTAALMGASIDIIARAGIWPAAQVFGAPLKRMSVVDDSRFPQDPDTMIEQAFDAHELGRDAFGWNLPLAHLRAALAARLDAGAFLPGTTLRGFETRKNHIAIDTGGKTLTARLLVGCDGRNSRVRETAGIDADRHDYGQSAITCLIGHARDHDNTSVEFHRPGGPFTLVPMPGRQSTIVWVEKTADAHALLKLPRPAFVEAIAARTRGRLGRITLETSPAAWPLEYLRARALTAPRVALAAEAAHVISPIGAQGLNLSLRDIAALADTVIEAHGLGLDIGSAGVLDRYARARKGDVATRSFAIDMANRLVASDAGLTRALRRLTLRALSLPGPVRKLVMKKGLAA